MKKDSYYEAMRWLKQAKEDLFTVEILIKENRFYMACFLSQQVAEKCLNAFLYSKGEEFVFGHSISKLCIDCSKYNKENTCARKLKTLINFILKLDIPTGFLTIFQQNSSIKMMRR